MISSEPVLDVLYRDGYDAVVVDVTATALPVSTVAKKLLTGAYGVELHKIGMSNPYTNGILKTSGGKPDIIYIVSEKDDVPDKRVRVGVATGMREAFECQRLKKVLFYPFCISHEEEITDFVIQQFLLASYKAFTWTPKAKTYDGTITLAGVSKQNCEQMQRMYEQLLDAEIRPRIAAVEALPKSPPQLPRAENTTEL
ncbi:unnamed protein product [Heligmosomoides polygyrus]|uniref:Uncharacterized protein n=1 Tax=Heligmosomoides polygyrus TaxID=6339 RepID=A0A3P8AJD8_HELPZ|nr:unnamed protein product [Heligmosomoides polygyrus]